jgi:integrase
VRTVKVPVAVKRLIDEWLKASERAGAGDNAPVFVALRRGGHKDAQDSLTAQAVYNLVVDYTAAMGKPKIRPHDLRRTAAKLMLKGGAPLDQISLTLGHDSLKTTQKYLGLELNLDDSAPDRVGLNLAAAPAGQLSC